MTQDSKYLQKIRGFAQSADSACCIGSLGGVLACLNLSESALLKNLACVGDFVWPLLGLRGVPPGDLATVTRFNACRGTGSVAGAGSDSLGSGRSFSLFDSVDSAGLEEEEEVEDPDERVASTELETVSAD
jgi:hypothetical protein